MSPTEADARLWAEITARKYSWHPQFDEVSVIAEHAALQAWGKYRFQPRNKCRNGVIGTVLKRLASFMRSHENLYRTHTRAGIPIPETTPMAEIKDDDPWHPVAADFADQVLEEMEISRKLALITHGPDERELIQRTVLEGEKVAEVAREWGMTRFALQKRREAILARARQRWEAIE